MRVVLVGLALSVAILVAPVVALAHPGQARTDAEHIAEDTALHDKAAEAQLTRHTRTATAADALAAAAAVVGNEHEVGKWGPLMPWDVVGIHVALLPNGKVLAYDSVGDRATETFNVHNFTRAIVWDPETGTQTNVNVTGFNVFCSGLAHLTDGSMFLAGGNRSAALDGIIQTHVFNYLTNTWSRGPDMAAGRWYPSVTPLRNGEMLITEGGPDVPEVRTTAGTLRRLTTASLNLPLYPWIDVAPDGRAFYSGPDQTMRALNTTGTGSWQTFGQRDTVNRDYGSHALYDIGRILVAGGGASSADARTININGATPQVTGNAPMANGRRQNNLTVLADGSVLATGGNSSGAGLVDLNNGVYAAELWSPTTGNPATGTWKTLAPETATRQYHSTALLLPDGRVLSSGGGICGTCDQVGYLAKNAQVFSPPYLFKTDGSGDLASRPAIGSAPPSVAYGAGFQIGTPDAAAIRKVALVRLGAVTHSVNMEQRYVPLTYTAGAGALTANAPANADIAPPGVYMLFVVDANGVPSVAKMVNVGAAPPGDTSPPSAPSGLTATAAGSTQVNLSWTAATDNVGVTGYRLERCQGAGCTNFTEIATPPGTTYSDTGRTASTTYRYQVRAADAAGNRSPYSTIASATTPAAPDTSPPTAPTGLTATASGSSQVNLSWTAATDNVGVTGYRLERCQGASCTDFTQIATPPGTTYSDTGRTASTTYRYQVRAADAAGNLGAYSTVAAATTSAVQATTPAFVQTGAAESNSGTSTSVSFTGNNSAGNLIVAYVIWNNGGGASVSDSRGNTYAPAGARRTWGSNWSSQVFYARSIAGGTNAVTATFATALNGGWGVVYAHEYSGVDKTNPLDVETAATGTSVGMNSGSVTTTSANDLLFSAGASASTVTAGGSGYTTRSTAFGNRTQDRNVSSVGTYNATMTQNSFAWVSHLVAFRAESGSASNAPPIASADAVPRSGPAPLTVDFSSSGSSDPEGQALSYSWTFGDGQTSTQTNPSHTYQQPGTYSARLSVSDGTNTTLSTPMTITVGSTPAATILTPSDGATFKAGDVISFSGDGTDADDGALPAGAFTWNIDLLHDGHVHPVVAPQGKTGSFTIPTSGHDFSGNTLYRVTLTVTDSDGLTDTKSVVIRPQKVSLSFNTAPAGGAVYLDGIAKAAPFVHDTLIGFQHTIEVRDQSIGGSDYTFDSWSDGGARLHTITVPATDHSYTATLKAVTQTAPPAFVQTRAAESNSGTSTSVSFTGNNSAGNLIVAYVIWNNAGGASVSDSRGNTYAPAGARRTWGSNWSSQVFYARNIAGGTNAVTATFATALNGGWGVVYAHEYSGVDKTNPLDVETAATGTSVGMNSGSVTTTSANDLLFSAGASASTVTAGGSGYTTRSTAFGNRTQDRNVSSVGTYNATMTQNSFAWVSHLVAFRAAAGG